MKIIEESSGILGVDNNFMEEIYDTNLNNLLKKGVIIDILKKQINNLFWSFYMPFIFMLIIIMGFPLLEFYISKKFKY